MLRLFNLFSVRLFVAICCLAVLNLSSTKSYAQLISWNPGTLSGTFGPSPWTPGTLNAALTSPTAGMRRGSSLATSGSPAGGCYGSSGGWSTGGGEANSFYFSITAACSKVSLSSFAGYSRRSGSGPTGCNIYYALDAGAYILAGSWNTTSTSGTSGSGATTTLSGISALQNIPPGTVIKIKVTPSGTTGNWYFTNTSLALNGTVTPVAAPAITTAPANATIPAASNTSFTVSGVTGAASYQWQRNTSGIVGGTWVNITSATLDPTGTYSGYTTTSTGTSNTLTLTNVPASWDGYGYRCVVTNCSGNTNSNAALLNVSYGGCSGTPAGGTATPTIATFCGSGSTTLNLVGGSSASDVTYQWSSSNTNTPPGTDIPGATSASYVTPALTETTYFWVTSTCPTTPASAISAVGVVTVNPTPVVTVTPPGGDFCSGTSGLNMTASGASTYSWAPAAGLSAVAGDNVIATPVAATVYTITGTSVAGCNGMTTVTVNSYETPGAITITPSSLAACVGSAVTPVTASLGSAGPATASSGAISVSFSNGAPAATPLNISSIPVGATVTGISVVFSVAQVSGGWNADDVIALKAPNGNILNLFNAKGGGSSTGGINGMEVNSTSVTAIPATGVTYTGGVYEADAALGVGAPGNQSNVTDWSDLYSIANGNWELLGHYTYTSGISRFTSWTITITYTLPSFTWTPATNLYTDVPGTLPYAGTMLNTVYHNPLLDGVTTYTVVAANGSCQSVATTTMTVTPLPTAITGLSSVCSGSAITLSNGVTGGTWSSSNTAAATVDATGVVTGAGAGSATIIYGNGCAPDATATVTIIDAPGAISGATSLCISATITLSNPVAGGVWSSNNTAVATIDPASGMVSGVAPGAAGIIYSTGCGTDAAATITVIDEPGAISGASSVCSGLTTQLSNSVAGGTWSSTITTVATVNASGLVTGAGAGNTVIGYSTGCGTDAIFNMSTISAPSAISGMSSVCVGATITLSDAVSGGTWSSGNTAVATIDGTGTVTGAGAGMSTINYATGCGTDATYVINVIAAPTAIAGASTLCTGLTTTLSESVTGGTWSSSNTAAGTVDATGMVTGVAAGATTINYNTGCGSAVNFPIAIIAAPAAITGVGSVCLSSVITLANTVAGGTWSSSNTALATVSSTGDVTGVAAGIAVINYTTGCGTDATKNVTVIAAPAAISGVGSICSGGTTQLSEAIAGGTWTSSNTTAATVSTTGFVTGVAAGTTTINYSTGCGSDVTHLLSVITAPAAISGAGSVCVGATTQLSESVSAGTWSSINTGIATVSATGLVSGVAAGATTIIYSTGCGTDVTKVLFAIAAPGGISGLSSVCAGSGIPLSNTVTGGAWTSSNSTIATVNGAGVVTGAGAGTVTIGYSTGCGANVSHSVTVIAIPTAITGPGAVCAGSLTNLNNSAPGGVWSSSNTSIATVNGFGSVSGIAPGQTTIRYSTGCGADATKIVSVLVAPAGISGASSVCTGSSITLGNATAGGTWSSSSVAVASVNGSGVVVAGVSGNTTITYATGCGMDQTMVITVLAPPAMISGSSSVCSGSSIALSNIISGGGWNSNNNPVATVDATGNVTGGIGGQAVISYSTGCGTDATKTITVISAPGIISGTSSVCPGLTTALGNPVAGGAWSSDNTAVATVNGLGVVTGVTPGVANIAYSTGCGTDATVAFTVNSLPAAPTPIFGATTVCGGSSTALSSFTPGGVWSSDNTAIATVDAAGVVQTLVAGSVTISYTVSNVCGNTAVTANVIAETPLTTVPAILGIVPGFCEAATIVLSDAAAGGAWSSDNTAIAVVSPSGALTGVAAGNTNISYTISNTCNSASATASVTVNPLPAPAPIIGSAAPFCEGTTIALSDPTPGGVWSSNITTIATVDNSGVVLGLAGGSSTIFYSLTNGCGTVATSLIITVDPLPVLGVVTGNAVVCAGATTQLSDTATSGAWTSGNTAVATVSNTGLVTGLAAGTATISYYAVNSCGVIAAVKTVTVNTTPVLGPITGDSAVCVGSSINLANAMPGGTWSTDAAAVANVNNLGVVVGVSTGIDTIRYKVTNACGTTIVAKGIEVLPASACDPSAVQVAQVSGFELKVFPNPNNGSFTYNVLSANEEQVQVVITDLVGKQVKHFMSVTNKEQHVTLDLAGGIYYLSAITSHGTYNAKVIIVN